MLTIMTVWRIPIPPSSMYSPETNTHTYCCLPQDPEVKPRVPDAILLIAVVLILADQQDPYEPGVRTRNRNRGFPFNEPVLRLGPTPPDLKEHPVCNSIKTGSHRLTLVTLSLGCTGDKNTPDDQETSSVAPEGLRSYNCMHN